METYTVFTDIDDNESEIEHLGTKEKHWFKHNNQQCLLKFSKGATGEHWAEKCAAVFCELLGIPHASYEIASLRDRWAVISPNFVPENHSLIIGNELLQEADLTYPATPINNDQIVRIKEHTVERVITLLGSDIISQPKNCIDQDLSAPDYFCGYLMLDALISNQDRHHENWAVLYDEKNNKKYLAPTFDHAASLGRELTDENRRERLDTKDRGLSVANFVNRARSELFLNERDKKPLTTVGAFIEACRLSGNRTQPYWLGKLSELSASDIREVFERVPASCMSDTSKEFAIQVVYENQKRLLEYV